MAQAPAPAPAASEPAPAATTTPPPAAEQPGQVSPWIIGGAGLIGVGIIAAIADDDDDGPSAPPIAEEPPPSPPPVEVPPPVEGPPANTAPTSPATQPVVLDADGSTAIPANSFTFDDVDVGDTLTNVRITGIQPNPVDPADPALQVDPQSNHGYEHVADSLTWEAARDAAVARGGYLAILDSVEEMQMVNGWYTLSTDASGATGTWIGAFQATGQASPNVGWTWVDGTPLDATVASPLWNNLGTTIEPNDADGNGEGDLENYAAIFDGLNDSDTHLIYDAGFDGGPSPNHLQPNFLIEYDTTEPLLLDGAPVAVGAVIAANQLGNLSWNSVFNTGGTLTFQVADASGAYSEDNTLAFEPAPTVTAAPPTMIALEDQHLNVLP
jgi:hypothetical protein